MSSDPVPLSCIAAPARGETFCVDASVYSQRVVLRAVHSLAPRIFGAVSSVSGGSGFQVELSSSSADLLDAETLRSRLFIALGDFVLRERLEAETVSSRQLIIAQAFERNNLQIPELDTVLPGSDPLGLSHPDPETGRNHDAAR